MNEIRSMSVRSIEQIRRIEREIMRLPQEEVVTHHLIHGGIYCRTVLLKAGTITTGVLVDIATTLVICGHVTVMVGTEEVELTGYHLLPAAPGRKQAFVAHEDTVLTMMFATDAATVEEAEDQFTSETDLLVSRARPDLNIVCITGVK